MCDSRLRAPHRLSGTVLVLGGLAQGTFSLTDGVPSPGRPGLGGEHLDFENIAGLCVFHRNGTGQDVRSGRAAKRGGRDNAGLRAVFGAALTLPDGLEFLGDVVLVERYPTGLAAHGPQVYHVAARNLLHRGVIGTPPVAFGFVFFSV